MDLVDKITEVNGKHEDWNRWSKTFFKIKNKQAHSYMKSSPNNQDDQKSMLDWKALHELAYEELMVSCQEDMTFV
jgi:hypothetical protein